MATISFDTIIGEETTTGNLVYPVTRTATKTAPTPITPDDPGTIDFPPTVDPSPPPIGGGPVPPPRTELQQGRCYIVAEVQPTISSAHRCYISVIKGFAQTHRSCFLNGIFSVSTTSVGCYIEGAYFTTSINAFINTEFPAMAAPNDFFVNAREVSGFSGYVFDYNYFASREIGEPTGSNMFNSFRTLWYKWVAPVDAGATIINTLGSIKLNTEDVTEIDTNLAIWTGTHLNNLIEIASNEDTDGVHSEVSFIAEEGTTYYIQLGIPFTNEVGLVKLSWNSQKCIKKHQLCFINNTEGQPCYINTEWNDNFADAQLLTGTSGSTVGTNYKATTEPHEFMYSYTPMHSVWYKWVVPNNTHGFEFITTDSEFSSYVMELFSFDSPDYGPSDSGIIDYLLPGTTVYIRIISTIDGEMGAFTLNWSTTPAQNLFLGQPAYIRVNEPIRSNQNCYISIVAAENTQSCYIPVGGPENDNFADAELISGRQGTVNGINVGATIEENEPISSAGFSINSSSIWYKWIAPSSETYFFDTKGSLNTFFTTFTFPLDTVLAIWTGTELLNLVEISSDDESGGGGTSALSFDAIEGTTYYIQISGYSENAVGDIILNWYTISQIAFLPCHIVGDHFDIDATAKDAYIVDSGIYALVGIKSAYLNAGALRTSSNTNCYIEGTANLLDQQNGFIYGAGVIIGGKQCFLRIGDIVQNFRFSYLNTEPFTILRTSTRAYVPGLIAATRFKLLYTRGHIAISSNKNLYIESDIPTISSNINAFIYGEDVAHLIGSDQAGTSTGAYLYLDDFTAIDTSNIVNHMLLLSLTSGANKPQECYIEGTTFSVVGNKTNYIAGIDTITDSQLAYINSVPATVYMLLLALTSG